MAMDYSDTGQFRELGKLALIWLQLVDLTRELTYDDGGSNLFHSLDTLREEVLAVLDSTAEQRDVAQRLNADIQSWMQTVDGGWVPQLKAWADEWLRTVVAPALDTPATEPLAILRALYLDMKGESETINGNAVAAGTPTAASHNAGSTAVAVSAEDLEADTNQLVRGQRVTVECTADAPHDSRTAGSELLTATAEAAGPAAGSGGSASLELAPATDTGAGDDVNRIENGSFETFTVANTPDDWTIVAGTAGTHILKEETKHYLGSKCLELQGDGAAATIELSQDLSALSPALKPFTKYAVHIRVKTADVTAGTIEVLLEGTAYTSTNQIEIAADWPTTWTAYTFFETLPKDVPSDLKITVKVTDTLNDDGFVYIDNVALVEATALPEAGLFLAAFQGDADPVAGDKPDQWTIDCTSDEAGRIQRFLRDLYGAYLPFDTGAGETIPDTLSQ